MLEPDQPVAVLVGLALEAHGASGNVRAIASNAAWLIAMRTETSTEIVDNFTHDGSGAISDRGPFSMTEEAVFTLTSAGQLVNRGRNSRI